MWLLILMLLATPSFAATKVNDETIKVTYEENITAEQWSKDREELVLQSSRLSSEIVKLQTKIDEGDARFSDNGIDFEQIVADKKAAKFVGEVVNP